jgi:hypothetical protein
VKIGVDDCVSLMLEVASGVAEGVSEMLGVIDAVQLADGVLKQDSM